MVGPRGLWRRKWRQRQRYRTSTRFAHGGGWGATRTHSPTPARDSGVLGMTHAPQTEKIDQAATAQTRSSDCGKRVARKNRVWQRPVEPRRSLFLQRCASRSFNRDGSGSRTYRVPHERLLCSVSMREPTLIPPRSPNGVPKQSSGQVPSLHVVHLVASFAPGHQLYA